MIYYNRRNTESYLEFKLEKSNFLYKILKITFFIQNMKKITWILIFVILFNSSFVANSEDNSENYTANNEKIDADNFKTLYSQNVKEICDKAYNVKSRKVFNSENYESAVNYLNIDTFTLQNKQQIPFKKAKENYRNNQNSIYKCALIDVQERAIQTTKNKLITIDKVWILKANMTSKLDQLLVKISASKKALTCLKSATNPNDLLTKNDIINESTYELCKYQFYLNYLKNYYSEPQNSSWFKVFANSSQQNKSVNVKQIITDYDTAIISINNEIKHTYKIFPLAFEAYSEYENNFTIHILLTIIKEDYIIVRDLLNNVLAPINQLVYKIKDAMSKN